MYNTLRIQTALKVMNVEGTDDEESTNAEEGAGDAESTDNEDSTVDEEVQVALRALTMKTVPSTRRLQVVKVEHRGYTWR